METALSIAGSDSGGGAGIQADLKTFEAYGVFGTTVVTAITAQNTLGVRGVWPSSVEAVRAQLNAVLEDFDIRAANPEVLAGRLSGGNQQKLLLAKILATDPEIVILDEPTRGVDIGAKAQIYRLIAGLAARGKSVVVVSSELPELIGLSHRIMVVDRGRIAGVLNQPENGHLSEAEILRLGLGLSHNEELTA